MAAIFASTFMLSWRIYQLHHQNKHFPIAPTYLGVIKIRLLCSPLNARVHKLKERTKSLPSNHLRSGRLISGYLIMYIHFNPCNLSLLLR